MSNDKLEIEPEIWSVTLRPNSSLTREGFIAIMAILVCLNLSAGIMFLSIGAWPIMGFMGLDVLLVWWAFRRNFSYAKRSEHISIAGDVVKLQRFPVAGPIVLLEFNRRWLKVELEFDTAREIVGRLFFAYRGKLIEFGSFLGSDDRQSLAKLLQQKIS